jgi:iron-sulfur cluster repair protein YtfE (RIC family)
VTHPTGRLAHDHRELSGLLIAVHAALSRVDLRQSKLADELHEIRDGVEAFREALLEHFAREQETLFPFVVSKVPDMRERCDGLVADHDRIAEMLTTLVKDLATAEASGALSAWTSTLNAMETTYSAHTKSELAFFDAIAKRLEHDAAAVEELRTLDERG